MSTRYQCAARRLIAERSPIAPNPVPFERCAAMFTRCIAVGLTAATLVGCGAVQIRSGTRVEPAQLETSLVIGRSTADDVKQLFGEPDGKGRDFLPTNSEPRTILSYFYDASMLDLGGSGTDSRRMYLIVFIRNERYDGYLWFSSLPEHRRMP